MLMKRFSCLSLVLAVCTSLPAQIPFSHRSTPGNELYGGYSYSFRDYSNNQDGPASGGMNGWQASFKTPVLPWIGLKVDASGYYKTESDGGLNPHIYFVMAGPQVTQHIGCYTVFVHGLIGTSHLDGVFPLSSNLTLAAAIGGGLDRSLTRNLAWRVTGDFLHTNFTPGGQETNQLHDLVSSNGRISTGPVLRF
jgi:hypothetical protein